MKFRIAIMAHHYDELHPRDVEVLEDFDVLVEAPPQQFIRVQTLKGEVQYQTRKSTLHKFNLTMKEME